MSRRLVALGCTSQSDPEETQRAVDAVQCAVAVQAAIATENAGITADEPMQFRIGRMSAM